MFLSLIMILARILEYKANRIIFVRSRKLTIYELFRKPSCDAVSKYILRYDYLGVILFFIMSFHDI